MSKFLSDVRISSDRSYPSLEVVIFLQNPPVQLNLKKMFLCFKLTRLVLPLRSLSLSKPYKGKFKTKPKVYCSEKTDSSSIYALCCLLLLSIYSKYSSNTALTLDLWVLYFHFLFNFHNLWYYIKIPQRAGLIM